MYFHHKIPMKGKHSKCTAFVEDLNEEQLELLEWIMKPKHSKENFQFIKETVDRINLMHDLQFERKINEMNICVTTSHIGFLGEHDHLKVVAAKDRDFLQSRHMTFEEFADLLEIYYLDIYKHNPKSLRSWQGVQICPFTYIVPDLPPMEASNTDFYIENKIVVSCLLLHLIRDHHFFEGNTGFRVDPQMILDDVGIVSILKGHQTNSIFSFYPYFIYSCPVCHSPFNYPHICNDCQKYRERNIQFDKFTKDLKILIGSWLGGIFSISEKITSCFQFAPELQSYYESQALKCIISQILEQILSLQDRLDSIFKNDLSNPNINEMINQNLPQFQEFLTSQIQQLKEQFAKLTQHPIRSIRIDESKRMLIYGFINDCFQQFKNTKPSHPILADPMNTKHIEMEYQVILDQLLTPTTNVPSENPRNDSSSDLKKSS